MKVLIICMLVSLALGAHVKTAEEEKGTEYRPSKGDISNRDFTTMENNKLYCFSDWGQSNPWGSVGAYSCDNRICKDNCASKRNETGGCGFPPGSSDLTNLCCCNKNSASHFANNNITWVACILTVVYLYVK